jgi:hypothetical protein
MLRRIHDLKRCAASWRIAVVIVVAACVPGGGPWRENVGNGRADDLYHGRLRVVNVVAITVSVYRDLT